MADSDDSGVPEDFKPCVLDLEDLAPLLELPAIDLIALLERDPALCDRVIRQSYDKRYSPSTFIEEERGVFRVGWYDNGYRVVRDFTQQELAVADYLLFSFGMGRLPAG